MSKQSEAKAAQGYREEPKTCSNCVNFTSDHIEKSYQSFSGLQTWTEEKNKRCAIGGFVVKKMATCDQWRGLAAKPKD
jgi:hypothetical protein